MTRRGSTLALLLAGAFLFAACASSASGPRGHDWDRFGYDAARHDASPDATITPRDVAGLKHRRVHLDGTVDSSPIYVANGVRGHDAFVVTTTYGRTEALDASTGRVLWRFTPPTYGKLAGTAQITNASPALSADGTAVYAAAPDGIVRKLRLATGTRVWARSITRDPTHEKITSSLNVSRGLVVATTGGYIGDAPPYQGHVVTISERTGAIAHVWNSLCSNRHTLLKPSSCGSSDSAIWSRNGAAVDPATGNLVVATGNGPFDGAADWGDSVLVLSPNASRLVAHWTPPDQEHLNDSDLDLGSTSPGLLARGYALQGGKDGKLRLLDLHHLARGALQTVRTPGGAMMFTVPAIWKGAYAFVATGGGTAAWHLRGGRLHGVWSNGTGGTSPVLAGGLLYVAGDGSLNVYLPGSGRKLASLPTGAVHWQSPVIADGHVAMPEGDANEHATSGVLDLFDR